MQLSTAQPLAHTARFILPGSLSKNVLHLPTLLLFFVVSHLYFLQLLRISVFSSFSHWHLSDFFFFFCFLSPSFLLFPPPAQPSQHAHAFSTPHFFTTSLSLSTLQSQDVILAISHLGSDLRLDVSKRLNWFHVREHQSVHMCIDGDLHRVHQPQDAVTDINGHLVIRLIAAYSESCPFSLVSKACQVGLSACSNLRCFATASTGSGRSLSLV